MWPVARILSAFQYVPAVFAQARIARTVAGSSQGELVRGEVYPQMNSSMAARVHGVIDVAN